GKDVRKLGWFENRERSFIRPEEKGGGLHCSHLSVTPETAHQNAQPLKVSQMNTHISAHKAKSVLVFQVHANTLSPRTICSVCDTKNQLQNGCSITYTFIERQNLSAVCYVKAAFPHILELLNLQFRFPKDSDNYRYANSLKNFINNVYLQRCIPLINEEIEDSPTKFARIYVTLPRTALEKAEDVIRIYMGLMTENNKHVDWNCEEEYAEDYPGTTARSPSHSAENSFHDKEDQAIADRNSTDRSIHSSFSSDTMFIIMLACSGLLLSTLLIYRHLKAKPMWSSSQNSHWSLARVAFSAGTPNSN
ncbi:hypothetical protein DNTS_026308, partial [Danionella cerebrum]